MAERMVIFFVDDEDRILSGLRRMLHSQQDHWDMHFFNSGADALAALDLIEPDIVVSDMRMPHMNGAELLDQIKTKLPHCICFILSGFSEKEMILNTIKSADQFLAKPCDPKLLVSILQKAVASKHMLNSQVIQKIKDVQQLPSLPMIYTQLSQKISEANCTFEDIDRIIRQDIAMTAKVLKLVNSAFFGLRKSISSIKQALVYLGIDVIKSIVLASKLFDQFSEEETHEFQLNEIFRHSMHVGVLASQFIADTALPPDYSEVVFMGGLLHDVGKLVLIRNFPNEYREILRLNQEVGSIIEAERKILDVDHAMAGGYLMSVWNIQNDIVNAIQFHHQPRDSSSSTLDLLTLVHVANLMEQGQMEQINHDYLQGIGGIAPLENWQAKEKEFKEKIEGNV